MPGLTLPDFQSQPSQTRILNARRKRNVARMGRRFSKKHLMQGVILKQPGGALAGRDGPDAARHK